MKRVTVTLDENVVRWVRAQARRQGTSVSRMINELLRPHGHSVVGGAGSPTRPERPVMLSSPP